MLNLDEQVWTFRNYVLAVPVEISYLEEAYIPHPVMGNLS